MSREQVLGGEFRETAESMVLNGDALDNKKLGLDLVFWISLFHLTPLFVRARERKRERRVFGCRENEGK